MKSTVKKTDIKKILQIGIPILIVFVIAGIWFAKNSSKPKPVLQVKQSTSNSDYALETLSLNLEKLKSYGLPLMIDFGADSCEPCKEMAPILIELNETYQGKVIIKFVDVWKNQKLADGFPLEVIPTQFFFDKNGNPYVPTDKENSQMILYSLKSNNEHVYTAHQGGMTKDMILDVFKELGVQ